MFFVWCAKKDNKRTKCATFVGQTGEYLGKIQKKNLGTINHCPNFVHKIIYTYIHMQLLQRKLLNFGFDFE